MASNEYYYGTAGAQQLQNQSLSNQYPPQPQYSYPQAPLQSSQNSQQLYNSPPPSYSPYPQQQAAQPQGYASQPQQPYFPPPPQQSYGTPPASEPYKQTSSMRQQYPPPPPPQQSGRLGVTSKPSRSHSQPPRVRFEDEYDSDSSGRSYLSDSDESSRRRRHPRRRGHSHSGHNDRSSSRDRDHHRSRHSERRAEHKSRDTFLGAGAGGLIGDAIFPGLGTAAGLILGGYGGRKHAQKRGRSEAGTDRVDSDRERHSRRTKGESGWDKDSATFKMGSAVR